MWCWLIVERIKMYLHFNLRTIFTFLQDTVGKQELTNVILLTQDLRIGFRIPSLAKRIAARTSVKRFVRHSLGVKTPRGLGWVTNPKSALYNRIYSRTTRGCMIYLIVLLTGIVWFLLGCELKSKKNEQKRRPFLKDRQIFQSICVV